ncbi:MAG: hypothetical protein JXB49_29580 [Bacteroidales bacterium]|nr:hypothetical protein [Bacteroidales bacterium]
MIRIKQVLYYLLIGMWRDIICKIRSRYYSRFISEGTGKIIINDPWLRVGIQKLTGAKLIVNGNLNISSHLGGTTPVKIFLQQNSILKIDGDFDIGQGVRISVSKNASLYFGGRRNASGSGITSDTLIMVFYKIRIGYDFICSWNVFISDSDWHQIGTQVHYAEIIIGDNVWIANNCSILKGTRIGNGSIVASHSKVINKEYPSQVLIAGLPARIIKHDITWSRDIMTT